MEEGDIVGYVSDHKRELFGDMKVVHVLPNNRVDVRRHESENLSVWQEYMVDLFVVETKRNGRSI